MKPWFPPEKPLLFAHRGSSAHAPENTLAAFRLAIQQGADGIELDAKLTADGQVVVIHDSSTLRTTGSDGLVRAKTLAELRALDAGSWFRPEFAGERIPTLEEVFAEVGGKCLIDIEITNYQAPFDGLARQLVEMVRGYRLEESILFSSFLPTHLALVRRLMPEVPAGLLNLNGLAGRIASGTVGRAFAPELILPIYSRLDEAAIAKYHQQGRQVIPWTVNDPDTARRLLAAGVNGIITDDPVILQAVFEGEEGET